MERGVGAIPGVARGVVTVAVAVGLASMLTLKFFVSALLWSRRTRTIEAIEDWLQSCREATGVVAACHPDVVVAVGIGCEIAPSSNERRAR